MIIPAAIDKSIEYMFTMLNQAPTLHKRQQRQHRKRKQIQHHTQAYISPNWEASLCSIGCRFLRTQHTTCSDFAKTRQRHHTQLSTITDIFVLWNTRRTSARPTQLGDDMTNVLTDASIKTVLESTAYTNEFSLSTEEKIRVSVTYRAIDFWTNYQSALKTSALLKPIINGIATI